MLIYLQMLETPEEKSLFEQIYLEYCGLMFHVAYEILHNEQDAEDAVHQAFVKIAENIKKIDAPVCPKTHSYVVTIMEKPNFLFLDEPTNAIDKEGVLLIRDIIAEEANRGAVVLLASHISQDISTLCTEIYHMKHGRIEE